MAREVKQWITVNGVHVPIFEGQSKEEAVKQAISRQKSTGPISKATRGKKIVEHAKKATEYASAVARRELAEKNYENAKKSGAEDRIRTMDRALDYAKDREKQKYRETAKAYRRADEAREKKAYDEVKFGKKNPNTKKEEQQKQMGPLEKEARKLADNPSGKLSKSEKFHMQMREAQRRREQGIPIKYGTPDHSKLSQHSEIQKIAEAHNEAVWTREGGVANKELYDAADKFAEQHNLPKDKVRKAAMAAFMQKHSESIKRRDAGQEPIEKKPSPAVNASGTMTPDQLAKAEKKRDALYNKQDHGSLNDSEKKELGQLEKSISGHYQSKKDAGKSSAPEFKNRQEAEEYYKNKFAGVSSTYANKMAKKLGIEGRGKDKREALAKHYTDQWETKSNISKNEADKEKQIARNAEEKKQLSSFGQDFQNKANTYREKFLTKKSDAEIAEIKKNLDKSSSLVGTTQEDHVAYKAIEDEMNRRKSPKKIDSRDTLQMHTLTDEEHLKNKINELNDLHDAAWKHGADTESIKSQIRQVMDHLPDGTVLARVSQNTSTQYTSQGAVQSQNTEISKLYKINGKWSRYKDGSGADDDVASSIIYNSGKWQTLEDAKKEAFEKQKDDYIQTKRYGVKEKWQATNEERKSAIQSLRNSGLSQDDAERKVDRMSPDQIRKLVGSQNKTIPKKIPASQVTISDSRYRFSTGKAPKGYGNWAFYLGDDDDKPIFFQGSYADAKKKAVREAANRGVNKIRVGT